MKKRFKGVTLRFITNAELSRLDSNERIKKLLEVVIDSKIAIVQGRLKAEEEARLIGDTMIMIGRIKGFKGVELAVVEPDAQEMTLFNKMKRRFTNSIVGENDVLTIVGPASIVREIKRNPEKIDLVIK